MRAALATVLLSVLIAAAAPDDATGGHVRLVGRTADGTRVVVEEAWRKAGGRVRLVRRTHGANPSCLEVEADVVEGRSARVAYRRYDAKSPVAVDLNNGMLRVQVGSVAEQRVVPGRPIPTSVLRFLPPGAAQGRRLLIEPYALVTPGHVVSYSEPGGRVQVLEWRAQGLNERLRHRPDGRLVNVHVPTSGLVLNGETEGSELDLAPCGPIAAAQDGDRFDQLEIRDLGHHRRRSLERIETPRDLEDWVVDLVEYETDDATVPTPAETLERGRTDCVGMAVLAGAAAGRLGWRSRQVLGVVDELEGPRWHQWVEVRREDRWVTVDPAAPYATRQPVRWFRPSPREFLAGEVAMLTWHPETGE